MVQVVSVRLVDIYTLSNLETTRHCECMGCYAHLVGMLHVVNILRLSGMNIF